MSHLQEILLGAYAVMQIVIMLLLAGEIEHERSRAKLLLRKYIADPIRDGLIVGDVLKLLFFGPGGAVLVLIFGFIPFTVDAFCWICDLPLLPKPPKKG